MKNTIVVFALLLINPIFGQALKIKKSPVYNDNKKVSELATMVDDNHGGVYAIRPYFSGMLGSKSTKIGYYIEHYNNDLKLLKTHTYKLENNKEIAAAFANDKQFYFITYQKDRKAHKINAIVNYTTIDEMKFKSKILFSVPSKNINSFYYDLIRESRKNTALVSNVSFSQDSKYALFYFDMYNRKEETHRVYVVNNEMDLVWSKEIKFQYKDRDFQVEDFQVTNNGTAYILAKVFNGGLFNRQYHYVLYKFNKEGLQGKVPFVSSQYYVSSLKMLKGKQQNTLNIVGFYSQFYSRGAYVDAFDPADAKGGSYRIRGVCTYQIATDTMQINTQQFQQFSAQFIADKYGKVRRGNSGHIRNGTLDNIVMRDVFYAPNGDMIVTAEEFEINVQQTSESYGTYNQYSPTNTASYSYTYGDAMLLRLDAKGKLIWSRNINKSMTSQSLYNPLSSFSVTASDDNVYLFLTANKKLGKLSKGRSTFKEGFSGVTKYNSKLYTITFDALGKRSIRALVDNKTSDVIYYSKLGIRMPDNSIYFFGRFRKDKQLMHIMF